MSSFNELTWRERRALVAEALDEVCAALTKRTPTVLIVGRVADRLQADRNAVNGIVLALAPECAHARHDGDIVWRFGRKQQRWNWYPLDRGEPMLDAPAEVIPSAKPDPHGGFEQRKEWLRLNHPAAYAGMYGEPALLERDLDTPDEYGITERQYARMAVARALQEAQETAKPNEDW